MGSDKALVRVGGATMLERCGSVLREAGASKVVVVGGADRAAGFEHITDSFPSEGPLGGILTALGALEAEYVAIVACDLPGLDADTVRRLMRAAVGHDVAMARTDRREPLCAVWRRTCRPALATAFERGERAPVRALGGLDVVEVVVDPSTLVNVNTPADLSAFGQAGN